MPVCQQSWYRATVTQTRRFFPSGDLDHRQYSLCLPTVGWPWQSGKSLVWTSQSSALSYVASAAWEARSAAEQAAVEKINKYTALTTDFYFQQIAAETLSPIIESACDFLSLLAKKRSLCSLATSERRLFLFQRLSILVQRFNNVLLYNSFICDDSPE